MRRGKQLIASVFLLFFAVLQIADLHIIQHDVDENDCVLCHISSLSESDDHFTFTPTDYSIERIEVSLKQELIVHHYITVDISSNYICANKAPPAI